MFPMVIVGIGVIVAIALLGGRPSGGKTSPAAKLRDRIRTWRETLPFVEELTYEETMKYFIQHKSDAPEIVKGALLKQQTNNGLIISQLFLDKNNKLVEKNGKPLGCQRKVGRLDGELLDLLKNDDLVIVE